MAKKETYLCDVCGTERKEANHWFVLIDVSQLFARTSAVRVRPAGQPDDGLVVLGFDFRGGFTVIPFSDDTARIASHHICGQVCAHKLLDQFLSGELK